MENKIIVTKDLGFSYSDNDLDDSVGGFTETPALKNVSIEIKEGEYLAVLGHNGSGKSTLAKLLSFILSGTVGTVTIDGVDVVDTLTEDEFFDLRKKVGMVFQNPDNQLVATVVREDVAFGPENLGLSREEIIERINEALSLVGMQEYIEHAPHKLSGGQKQRVAIAGIIAMRPKVIIFDESTAMLDPTGRRAVIEIMEKLNREDGVTVINITHYMEEAARADRVIVVNDGEIILDGTAKDVFYNVQLLRSLGLEAPQGRELIFELASLGLIEDNRELTEEECIKTLLDLTLGKSE